MHANSLWPDLIELFALNGLYISRLKNLVTMKHSSLYHFANICTVLKILAISHDYFYFILLITRLFREKKIEILKH